MANYDRYLDLLQQRWEDEDCGADERDLDTDAERERENAEDLRRDYEPEGEK